MRSILTIVHRWAGLLIAAFLFVSGITGAVISWDHELDDLLNSHLTKAGAAGEPLPPLTLAQLVEERDPRVRVNYVPLAVEPGDSFVASVEPRVDPATARLYELGYNEVFLDPVTGDELGRREWGAAWPISRENFVSFLYVLHYSLHIPEFWGTDLWGLWLLGVIALIWTADNFVGFYLTLPARGARPAEPAAAVARRGWWARWKPAWQIKRGASPARLNFDIHRAFGLWTWGLLFALSFTAFSLNLYDEVFYPLMSTVSDVTPSPYDLRTPADEHEPIEPSIGFAAVIAAASSEARQRGWSEPVGGAYYDAEYGIYAASFFAVGDDHGAAGVGPAELYYDGKDGRLLGDRLPWHGTAADLFVQAQFPVHSGRILGIPGRVLVSAMGLVVAALSVTGVLIWWRKRAAARASESRGVRTSRVPAGSPNRARSAAHSSRSPS